MGKEIYSQYGRFLTGGDDEFTTGQHVILQFQMEDNSALGIKNRVSVC